MNNNLLDVHDKELIDALIQSNMQLPVIARKFEVPVATLASLYNQCDFYLTDNVLMKNVRLGRMVITEIGIEKRCTICQKLYPLTRQFWHVKRKNQLGDREMGHCKACETVRKLRQKAENDLAVLKGTITWSTKYLDPNKK